MKYNLGTFNIKTDDGWVFPKNIYVNQKGTWVPVRNAYVKKDDGTWERIWPIPKGVLTKSSSNVNHVYYQNYTDTVQTLTISNTGDFDLTINSIVVNDDVKYTTDQNLFPSFPVIITPGQTTNLQLQVSGNDAGTFIGNIELITHTGYLGYANTVVTQTVRVIPDYNGIDVSGTVPILTAYRNQDSVSYDYSGYTSTSFTAPVGTTSLAIDIGGGGGGGGGNDSHAGSPGYPGHTVTGTISVSAGQTVGVYVGGGGKAGVSGRGSAGGGAGGTSGLAYSGGAGGSAGPAGSSGGGGGGGAATVITVDGSEVAVAAGGGGGGGGGNHSNGYGQVLGYTLISAGAAGSSHGGDGGGGGGGGGGRLSGRGGSVNRGDNGGYTGSDGTDLAPFGASVGRMKNGGAATVAGSGGYARLITSGLATSAAKQISLKNTGNGKTLNINSITAQNGFVVVSDLTDSSVEYDFNTNTNGTTQFTVTPYSTLSPGTYNDVITVSNDSANNPSFKIPVTIVIREPSGNATFLNPGSYSWTVPNNVEYVNIFAAGGGGGGGVGSELGSSKIYADTTGYYFASPLSGGTTGGGGGSGGYNQLTKVRVTPGEVFKIRVGAGGAAYPSRNTQLYAVSLDGRWSSLLNTYGVWTTTGQDPVNETVSASRMWTAPYTGNYTLEFSVDDYGTVYIDGVAVSSYNSWTATKTTTFSASQGNRVITINAVNTGGPTGFAATIKDTDGNMIWNTRTQLSPGAGNPGASTTVTGGFGTLSVTGGTGGGQASSRVAGSVGTGGSPNGVDGSGSTGGNNSATVIAGGTTLGPYGQGGAGGSPSSIPGASGASGAVIITWGNG